MITIAVYDKHRVTREALTALLMQNDEFNAIALECDAMHIADKIKSDGVSVLIVNMYEYENDVFALIRRLSQRFERLRTLVMSHSGSESLIVKSIKSGAKGFLDSDADRQELFEAVYTLRNGYDFYSKSISHLLLGKYINGMLTEDKQPAAPGIDILSPRQIEILRLWGSNKTNREIADELYLSVRTVESHKNHIMQKLNLKTTVDMIKFGIRNNLIDL